MPMLTPDSFFWRALEFYGTRVHHRGKWRIHEGLRRILRINYSGNLEVRRHGLRWILNPGDFVQSSFYWTGEFEQWDWYHLSRLVRAGNVVFDVGANFGFYSIMLAHTQKAKVFSFEPARETFSKLQSNIAMNGLEASVIPAPLALSDEYQSGFLSTVEGNSGGSFLSDHGDQVTLDTIDHYCSLNGIKSLDFIKIDVEGHELQVLKGAQKTIDEFKPSIMIEFNADALRRSGSSTEDMASRLRTLGYGLFVPCRKELAPFKEDSSAGGIFNVFAVHRAT